MKVANEQSDFSRDGLNCPRCGCPESAVKWTRHKTFTLDGRLVGKTMRRRECEHCGCRFLSTERVTEV